jgi:hypothetical protein
MDGGRPGEEEAGDSERGSCREGDHPRP